MTPSPAAVDPVVRAALQHLPVPDHGAGFWERVGVALADEPSRPSDEPALAVGPPLASPDLEGAPATAPHRPASPDRPAIELRPDPSRAVIPPALRSRGNLALAVVALVAAAVVVVAGLTLVQQRAGTSSEEAGDSGATSTSSTTVVDDGPDSSAGRAVLGWVAAVAAGDLSTAWSALGPSSQAAFGSRSTFEAEQSALAEGFGAWAATPPDQVFVTPAGPAAEGQLVVVTLVGTVSQEGTSARRAVAVPVRLSDGSALLEPFAFAGELDVVVPAPRSSDGAPQVVGVDEALVVVVPRGAGAPIIRLDDGEALVCGDAPGTELVEVDGAAGRRCIYQPDGGIQPGERVLTIVLAAADGAGISAQSVLFEAA